MILPQYSAQEVLIKEGVLILIWFEVASTLTRCWIIQDTLFNNVVDWLLGLDDITACVRSYVDNELLSKEKRFGIIIGQLFLWM